MIRGAALGSPAESHHAGGGLSPAAGHTQQLAVDAAGGDDYAKAQIAARERDDTMRRSGTNAQELKSSNKLTSDEIKLPAQPRQPHQQCASRLLSTAV